MALVANSRMRRSLEGYRSATMANSVLPEDLHIEVLSRLPVKALIRFKSVCKRWYDLISNPNFISTHLKNNSTNRVHCDDDDDNFCGLKVVSFDVVDGRYPSSIYDFMHLNLNVDSNMKETPLDVVDYCDGMFCLSSSPLTRMMSQDGDLISPTTIVLHNPALRETRVLPPSHSYFPPDQWICSYNVGFGFDQKTKDYKVVKVVVFKKLVDDAANAVSDTVVEVYSLGTDSWRVIDNAVKDVGTHSASATTDVRDFANGILCWSFFHGFPQKEEVVVPFHIDDETFRLHLGLPANHYSFNPRPYIFLHLVGLNHKLALIRSHVLCPIVDRNVVDANTWVEIWVMTNSCDVEKPWSLLFTVESFPAVCTVLGFWNTNVVLMYDMGASRPILYDLVAKQYTDLQLFGELDIFYKESLVSVKRTIPSSENAVQV